MRLVAYCRGIPDIQQAAVLVKVGANDGTTGDPFAELLEPGSGWRGLLIEPVPYCVEKLKTRFGHRNDVIIEQAAVGAGGEPALFYFVDLKARGEFPSLPVWFDQLGSFNRSHIVKHFQGKLEPYIRTCQVKVCPLSEIMLEHDIQYVGLLQIDTEGYDYEVLKSLDFGSHAPLVVFVEHQHLKREHRRAMAALLRHHGYRVWRCYGDFIAVNRNMKRELTRNL